MKRILAMIMAVLMMATLFVGCNKGGEKGGDAATELVPEQGATLKLWVPTASVETFKAECDEFIKLYPDAGITIDVKPQGENDVAGTVRSDPEEAADVFHMASDQLAELRDSKLVSPVVKGFVEDVKARNDEFTVSTATTMYNGEETLLAYPSVGDNGYFLVYDKSVISDEDAKTFEGILAACRKAGKKFIMDAGNGYYSIMFPATGGFELNGYNEEGTMQVNEYDEEAVVDSLMAFADLFHEYSDVFSSASVDKIASGMAQDPKTVAAGIDGSWDAKGLQNALGENLGAAKLPTINVNGEDKQIISLFGTKLFGVKSTTKYPIAAHLLANYLSNEACQKDHFEKLGWGPSNNAVRESDAVKNNVITNALYAQAEYGLPMVDIKAITFSGLAPLGNYLFKAESYDRASMLEEFNKTVKSIKDEV